MKKQNKKIDNIDEQQIIIKHETDHQRPTNKCVRSKRYFKIMERKMR